MENKSGTRIVVIACAVVVLALAGFLWLHHRATESVGPPFVARGGAPPPRELVGIGVAVRMDPQAGTLMIEQVVPNTPAARAGLVHGQIISRIGDTPTTGRNLKECIDLLRGPEGTAVRLELISPDQSATNSVELTREKITV